MAEKQSHLKVIIVGGSIAGLTLAHCLEQGGIDFILLEGYSDIAPQVGASIGLLPNGARVLDQLGIWDSIERLTEPLKRARVWTGDGKLLSEGDIPELIQARTGYPSVFLDRQLVLQVLFDRLLNPSKVLLRKRVVSVDHSTAGVTVHCKDGSQYTGDIVAGADGIHSVIREEMWRYCEGRDGLDIVAKDKRAITATFRCLFGISSPILGLIPGDAHRVWNEGWSALVIIGKEGRCFWFIFERLDKTYTAGNIPRYNKADEASFAKAYMDRCLIGTLAFKDLWESRITSSLLALEEAQHGHWTVDRFVCIGDSIHKMTPHSGQGGNNAIESAAALANSIMESERCATSGISPLKAITRSLELYESSRRYRANETCAIASKLTRIEAMEGLMDKFMCKYVLPRIGDKVADEACEAIVGATKLSYLPVPRRSPSGMMPFDPHMGLGQSEDKLYRAAFALPLLAVACFAAICPILQSASFSFPGLHLLNGITKDGLVGVMSSFAGTDPVQKCYLVTYLGGLTSVQTIWAVESARRGNHGLLSFLSPLVLGCLSQFKGISFVAPLYSFIHYVQTPQEIYHAADNRMVPTNHVKAIIPAIVFGYIAPTIALFLPVSAERHDMISFVWQLHPLWTTVIHCIVRSTFRDTTQRDRIRAPTTDMPHLRRTYLLFAVLSGLAHTYAWVTSPVPLQTFLVSNILSFPLGTTIQSGEFEQWHQLNQALIFGSGLLLEMLHFRDMKKAKKLQMGWIKVLCVFGGTLLFLGPGSTLVLGWAWREEILASAWPIAG